MKAREVSKFLILRVRAVNTSRSMSRTVKPSAYSFDYTVEPLFSGHPLSGHPPLSGQLLKSQNYFQYNTVNKIPFKRPPLLRGRGHLSAVPMCVLLLFLPLFSGQQECNIQCLDLFSASSDVVADKIIEI